MLLLVIAATMASTFLGGRMALRLRDKLDLVMSFSAGAVIGLVLLDLLPEAMTLSAPHYAPAQVTSLVALGFLLSMVANSPAMPWSHEGSSHEGPHDPYGRGAKGGSASPSGMEGHSRRTTLIEGQTEPHRGALAAGGLCMHSFLDGMGIGLGLKISLAVGLIITVGVITHDFSDGVNTVSVILAHRGGVRRASGWLIADALAPAFGALSTLFFSLSHSALGLVLALFSGFFLYVGASDLLPESHRGNRTLWPVLLTLLGAGTLYIAVRLSQL